MRALRTRTLAQVSAAPSLRTAGDLPCESELLLSHDAIPGVDYLGRPHDVFRHGAAHPSLSALPAKVGERCLRLTVLPILRWEGHDLHFHAFLSLIVVDDLRGDIGPPQVSDANLSSGSLVTSKRRVRGTRILRHLCDILRLQIPAHTRSDRICPGM